GGTYEPNRTAADTIATFGEYYEIDISTSYPLLTTKRMDTFRWDSMLHELVWYLSGEHHVRNLREKTGIWDAWADEDWNLPSAYGRFWRRFPVPAQEAQLPGEVWVEEDSPWVTQDAETGTLVFDQIAYVVDTLRGDNPNRGRNTRRLVVTAWHPGNMAESTLPPCHYTFTLRVQNGRLNCHLTQRSADVALGVPFNIAAYALLTEAIASATGLEPGIFGHTLVDAHIYCGGGDRGAWYADHLEDLQARVAAVSDSEEYRDIRAWILDEAPPEADDEVDPASHQYGYDHVPGLLEQLAREPLDPPTIDLAIDEIDDLTYEAVTLQDYESHDGLRFAVAE
ncbi:MAG: thymidylate synthase, partial [Halobacteriales archaeon]|nr:thymidylate synthase [Halobacteriales archaeon]